jgi:hypothetical protein
MKKTQTEVQYEQSASIVKIHGILSIVFGSIGVAIGLIFLAIIGFTFIAAVTTADVVGIFIIMLLVLLFWILPQAFLIVSGVTLLREPDPRVVRILTITTLVISALENVILLATSIATLLKLDDYEQGYPDGDEDAE